MAATTMLETTVARSPAAVPIEDEPLYEVVSGEVVEKQPMAANAVRLASILLEWIAPFVRRGNLGRASIEILYLLDSISGLRRRPDFAFVSFDRWPKTSPVPPDDAWPVVPDLAVEVISPSNSATEIKRKIGEYFAAGVRMVWVVYPDVMLVEVYDSPTSVHILDRSKELDGGPVLPGFRLALADLFEDAVV